MKELNNEKSINQKRGFLVGDMYATPRRPSSDTSIPKPPRMTIYGQFSTLAEAIECQKAQGGFITEIGRTDEQTGLDYFCLYSRPYEMNSLQSLACGQEEPGKPIESDSECFDRVTWSMVELIHESVVPKSLDILFLTRRGGFVEIHSIKFDYPKLLSCYHFPLIIKLTSNYKTGKQDICLPNPASHPAE